LILKTQQPWNIPQLTGFSAFADDAPGHGSFLWWRSCWAVYNSSEESGVYIIVGTLNGSGVARDQ